MEEVFDALKLVSVALVGVLSWVLYGYGRLWYESQRVRNRILMQGIKGPPPSSFLHGNLPDIQRIKAQVASQAKASAATSNESDQLVAHDYTTTLFPYFEHWRKQYGLVYTYSTGWKQNLYVNQPDLVRELNQAITLVLGKPGYLSNKLAPMLGNGVLRSNGNYWAQQRKLVAAEFFMDKVKGMVDLMVESALPLLDKWEQIIESQGGTTAEIKVEEDFRGLSADVISRVCFGHSFSKGKEVFDKIREIQMALTKDNSFLFGSSLREKLTFWSNKKNKIANLEKEIASLIWDIVEHRKKECSESSSSSQKDLMQLLLEAATSDKSLGKDFSKRFIVDNCKNIYFAGHETTSVAACWCLMLLGLHTDWQTRIRAEVAEHCPNGIPNADSITQLKTLGMVIQEVLRLYPPASFVSREAFEDIQIGHLNVPKGAFLWTLIPTLHRDPEIWGPDANEFKPERFSEGVSKACKSPSCYAPFGYGTRLCLGRNFAMVELKVWLALIISRFSFTLSPNYRHSPMYIMIVEPEHGVDVIIQKN